MQQSFGTYAIPTTLDFHRAYRDILSDALRTFTAAVEAYAAKGEDPDGDWDDD